MLPWKTSTNSCNVLALSLLVFLFFTTIVSSPLVLVTISITFFGYDFPLQGEVSSLETFLGSTYCLDFLFGHHRWCTQ